MKSYTKKTVYDFFELNGIDHNDLVKFKVDQKLINSIGDNLDMPLADLKSDIKSDIISTLEQIKEKKELEEWDY